MSGLATGCRVLQCVAVCCSVLQCVEMCCSVPPYQVRGTAGGIDDIDVFQIIWIRDS